LEIGYKITVDNYDNVFITGYTDFDSTDFPTTIGAYDTIRNGPSDVFVIKMKFDFSALYFSTFLGGDGNDYANGIFVDRNGNVYITGSTEKSIVNFPTTNGSYCDINKGDYDIYATKLNPEGSVLLFSTLLGGNRMDKALDILVDYNGNTYITGYSNSNDYPVSSDAIQNYVIGLRDIIFTKLDQNGSSIIYSTLIGGNREDIAFGIDIDRNNNIYIVGSTEEGLVFFPTTENAYDITHNGNSDIFVLKFRSNYTLEFSTYIGGSGFDSGNDIVVDDNGDIYITGRTDNTLYEGVIPIPFPTTPDAYCTSFQGEVDSFVIKINSNGTNIIYSTYLGGSDVEAGESITLDSSMNACIAGTTRSNDYPTVINSYDPTFNGGNRDAYISMIDSTGSYLLYSSYIGGISDDIGNSITLDSSDNAIMTGYTESIDFPTIDKLFCNRTQLSKDIYISKFNLSKDILPPLFIEDSSDIFATTGDTFHFVIEVRDNIEVAEVDVEYWFDDSIHQYFPLNKFNEDKYSLIITIPSNMKGQLSYYFHASDTYHNENHTLVKNIEVNDNDSPIFLDDLSDEHGIAGHVFHFITNIIDNIEIDNTYLEYWYEDNIHINITMDKELFYTYNLIIPINYLGKINYRFHSVDSSSNWNQTSPIKINVIDIDVPVFVRDMTPRSVGTGQALNFSVNISDNVGLSRITLEYWTENNDHEIIEITGQGSYNYTIIAPINSTDEIHYSFIATDNSGNYAFLYGNVSVLDIIDPTAIIDIENENNEDEPILLGGGRSYDNIGIIDYIWKIDNYDLILHGEQVEYIFLEPGNYTISLKVIDLAGNSDIDQAIIKIKDITPPIVDAGEDMRVGIDEEILFNGSACSDNVGIFNWTWSFDYLGPRNLYGKDQVFTFHHTGVYEIRLTVTDAAFNEAMDILMVTVFDNIPPEANAGPDVTVVSGSSVLFDGKESIDNLDVIEWTWNFIYDGHEITLSGEKANFTFQREGNYTVRLMVRDLEGNSDEDYMVVTVTESEKDHPSEEREGYTVLLILIILGVIILVSGLVFVVRYKRNGVKEE